jgi:hypothetical protein
LLTWIVTGIEVFKAQGANRCHLADVSPDHAHWKWDVLPGRVEPRGAALVAGERMCAFDDPVDLIVDMLEKVRAVKIFRT